MKNEFNKVEFLIKSVWLAGMLVASGAAFAQEVAVPTPEPSQEPVQEAAQETKQETPVPSSAGGTFGGFEITNDMYVGKDARRWSGFGIDKVNASTAAAYGDANVLETLRAVPGVQVQTSGSLGEQATIRLRGTTEDQNLVLLDDVPLNSPFDNAYDFADFMAGGVGTIDVQRGAQSGYYGSSAMGGVVNMNSSAGEGDRRLDANAWGGSFATFRETVSLQEGHERWAYNVEVSRTDKGDDLDHDGYQNTTGSLRLDFKPIDKMRLTFVSRAYDASKELPIDTTVTNVTPFTVSFVPDANRMFDSKFLFNTVRIEGDVNRWYQPSLQAAYVVQDQLLSNPPDTSGSFNPNVEFTNIDFQRLFVRSNHDFLLYPGIELEGGYELTQDRLDVAYSPFNPPAYASLINNDRTIHAGILQLSAKHAEWFAKASGRYDNYSDFGDVVSPQVQLGYHYKPYDTIIKAGYSRGFRAPSFRELSTPVVGNQNLEPETAHTFELGVEKNFPNNLAKTRATLFYNKFEELITIGSLAKFTNVESARSAGAEFEACIAITLVADGCVAYTFTDTEIDNADGTSNEIPLISKHNLAVELQMQLLQRLWLRFAANYRGEQSIAAIPNVTFQKLDGTILGNETDPFVKVDLDARYNIYDSAQSFLQQLDVKLHGENLLNQDVEEFPGFPNPGITLLAGLHGRFL